MTADETWPSRLTRHIAAQIRYHRRQRKWSAQRLDDPESIGRGIGSECWQHILKAVTKMTAPELTSAEAAV